MNHIKLAEEWIEAAKGDLKTIEHIIEDDFLTHHVAFHSQQATEKLFKSILVFHKINIPKIHSTIRLYAICKEYLKIDVDTNLLTDFDDLYIDTRYPSCFGLLPDGKPTLKDAKEFYECAENIYNEVISIICK